MRTNSKGHSKGKVRVADFIANFLVAQGIKDIFVLTGFGAMYLNDAIATSPKLKYYCVRNEATSPMMAEAYARIKKSLGAVCLTSGPGSTNAIPGLAEAWVDSAPILILSGQVTKKHTTYYSNTPGLRTFGTAEINIVPIVRPLTKYAQMIINPNSIRYHLERAVYLAINGRPGPVWLDIPQDIQYAMVDPQRLKGYTAPNKIRLNTELSAEIQKVIRLLKNSKQPLLVVGQGVKQAEATDEFYRLLSLLKTPVIFSRLGLDILPYSHPMNMGLGGIKGTKYCAGIMNKADLIIALGARLAIPFVGSNLDAFNKKARIVAVDIEQAELKKPGIKINVPVNADVFSFIKTLNQKITESRLPDYSDWLRFCQKLKFENPLIVPKMKKNPIDLYYFMSRLDACSDSNHIFITDAGSNYYVGGQVFRFEKGQKEVTSATFAAMGLSVPLAIGAAIAKKNAQILAVTGDGSLELNVQELKTMSFYNLDIKLFVINNGGYVSMRNWQDKFFKGRRIGSDKTTGVPVLNLKRVAAAFDLKYEKIVRVEEIDSKLNNIMKRKGPLFVEVFCDNNQNIIEPIRDF